MSQDNPYESPNDGGGEDQPRQKTGAGSSLYVHSVASLGALIVFAGGFLAAFVIPTMVSEELASSRQWVTILLILAIAIGLVCAFLSYRGTLKTYAKKDG